MSGKYSLNELEALAKKATRGAGYPWGLAEDAGKATRWLCARGIDGAAVLDGLLTETDAADLGGVTPLVSAGGWSATAETLCPLITGAALSDRAGMLESQITLRAVHSPALLLYFLSSLSVAEMRPVTARWDDTSVALRPDETRATGKLTAQRADVTIQFDDAPGTALPDQWRTDISAEVAARLNALAHRTYAPATEESRRAGAGAGLSDND